MLLSRATMNPSRFLHAVRSAVAAIATTQACSPVSATHPSAPDASTSETVMEVDHYRIPCLGPANDAHFCLRVTTPAEGPSTMEESGIPGFKAELGRSYRIRVQVRHIANPPADAPNTEYKFVQVVSQTIAPPGTEFSITMYRFDADLLVAKPTGELELKGDRKLACVDEGACRAARSWIQGPAPAPSRYGPGPSLHLTLRYPDRPGAPLLVAASSISN
jgi:hypothetical protein